MRYRIRPMMPALSSYACLQCGERPAQGSVQLKTRKLGPTCGEPPGGRPGPPLTWLRTTAPFTCGQGNIKQQQITECLPSRALKQHLLVCAKLSTGV